MKIESGRKALIYLIAHFMVGLAIGGVGGFTVGYFFECRMPSDEKIETDLMQKFTSQMKLSAEQQRALRPILHDAVQETGEAWKEMGTRTKAAFMKCQQRMEPLLNARQRAELSEIMRKICEYETK